MLSNYTIVLYKVIIIFNIPVIWIYIVFNIHILSDSRVQKVTGLLSQLHSGIIIWLRWVNKNIPNMFSGPWFHGSGVQTVTWCLFTPGALLKKCMLVLQAIECNLLVPSLQSPSKRGGGGFLPSPSLQMLSIVPLPLIVKRVEK